MKKIGHNIDLLILGGETLERIEDAVRRAVIEIRLEQCGGNQVQAAKLLVMHRNTLSREMHRLRVKAVRIPKAKKPVQSDLIDYCSPNGALEAAEKGWEPKEFVSPERVG